MTIDYKAATDYRGSTGYDDAIADASLAGEGGSVDGFVERMAERIGGKASVRAVFGEPIERDGITIIPVAKVRWGFGGGAGRGPIAMGPGIEGQAATEASMSDDASQSGAGSGGGGGVTADPIGYLEIGPDGANFRPITPVMPSPGFLLAAGVTAMLVLRGLAALIRR